MVRRLRVCDFALDNILVTDRKIHTCVFSCLILTVTGCSYPPTYDGIGADEYMEWEIVIDNIFATCFMCPRRKVKNVVSVLRHSTLSWWESLDPSDKPQT